jgi:KWG Leptospira.
MRRNTRLLFISLVVAALITLVFNADREAQAGSPGEAELATVCVDDWCGYVDDQGRWRITPRFAAADPFSQDGLAWVILSDEQDQTKTPRPFSSVKKIGLINTQGKLVDSAAVLSWVKPFTSQGLAAAKPAGPAGGKGFINRQGQWVIEAKFAEVWSFADNGLAKVRVRGKSGFINTKGEWVIEPQFAFVWPFSANGLAAARIDSQPGTKNGPGPGCFNCQWGFINGQGHWAIEPRFEDAEPFASTGLAKVKSNGRWGFINSEGQWLIEAQFDYTQVGPFADNGLAKATKNGKWGLINTNGQWVAEPQFNYINPFAENGLAEASDSEQLGFIDRQGRWAIAPRFNDAGPASDNGQTRIRNFGNKGSVNAQGDWAAILTGTPFMDSFSKNDLAIVTAAGSHARGVINYEGHWVVGPKFERLDSPPFSLMGSDKINDRWVHIDHKGQWLGEFLYGDWVKKSVAGNLMKGDLNVRTKKLYRTGVFVDTRGLYRTGLDENPEEPGFRWEIGGEGRVLFNRRGQKILTVVSICGTEAVRNGDGAIIWPPHGISEDCDDYEIVGQDLKLR